YQSNLILRIVRSTLSYYNLISQSGVDFVSLKGGIERKRLLRGVSPYSICCPVAASLPFYSLQAGAMCSWSAMREGGRSFHYPPVAKYQENGSTIAHKNFCDHTHL
ncbi:MAG: hypothetical protein MUO63_13930, partial [Desulfobulbaceae bacterium]|nr:hypothetical protein [Desulfobulbaceae bacterium]